MPVERHASPALALSPGAAGREALASSWGDTSPTCVPLARRCALGKANDASGLTEESRYTIHRVDAHAEKSAGRGARLSQLAAGMVTVYRTRTTYPAPRRTMRQDTGYLYILRTDAVRTPATAAYRVTFSPEGNQDVYLRGEDGLRSFLKDADITAGHIEQAVSALREDPERVIEDVRLTPHQVTTLGFWSDVTG